jgi:hypothetical protein
MQLFLNTIAIVPVLKWVRVKSLTHAESEYLLDALRGMSGCGDELWYGSFAALAGSAACTTHAADDPP